MSVQSTTDKSHLLLACLPDHDAEVELRRQLARELAREQYRAGYAAGWLAAIESVKTAQQNVVTSLELEHARYLVLCRKCRLEGRRDDCADCVQATRPTFGTVHEDDYKGAGR